MLLGLNGLRCGELVACNVEDVGTHSWQHTLKPTTTKGDRPTVVALAPPTMQAVALAINGRPRKALGFMTPSEKFAEAVARMPVFARGGGRW